MEATHASPIGTGPVPPPPGPPDGHGQPTRLLRRPVEDRVVFGVAGGLGRYLGIDPVLVRIAFVALTIFGGSGVLLYLVGLIAIPEERPGDAVGGPVGSPVAGGQGAAVAVGAALIVIGTIALVGQVFPGLRDLVGPLLLLSAGALVIAWGGRR